MVKNHQCMLKKTSNILFLFSEWILLYVHYNIATEGSQKPELYPTLCPLELLQMYFIVHITIGNTIHYRRFNSLEHYMGTALMTNIRICQSRFKVLRSFEPRLDRMSHWGRSFFCSIHHIIIDQDMIWVSGFQLAPTSTFVMVNATIQAELTVVCITMWISLRKLIRTSDLAENIIVLHFWVISKY